MKKALILFTAVIALCTVASCKKEPVIEHPLNGTWGLVYMESSVSYTDPALQPHSDKYECDPFHPSTRNDCKIVCNWTSGDEYETTGYLWDTDKNEWHAQIKYTISIVDGNKLFQTIDGRTNEVGTITFQKDMMTLVGTSQARELDSGEVYSTMTFKETFKKME